MTLRHNALHHAGEFVVRVERQHPPFNQTTVSKSRNSKMKISNRKPRSRNHHTGRLIRSFCGACFLQINPGGTISPSSRENTSFLYSPPWCRQFESRHNTSACNSAYRSCMAKWACTVTNSSVLPSTPMTTGQGLDRYLVCVALLWSPAI